MAWNSPAKEKEEATKRPPEGWSTNRVNKVSCFESKNVEYIKFELEHENGSQFAWMISRPNRISILNFTKICELEGLSWPDGTSNEALADLLAKSLPSLDVNIKWGNGDGVFINDVAPAGAGGPPSEAQPESPSTSKPKLVDAPPPRTRTKI